MQSDIVIAVNLLSSYLSMAGIRVAKSAIFFFSTLLGLSPILKTLTSPISNDTIWALTVCCFLANILFHDYVSQRKARVK